MGVISRKNNQINCIYTSDSDFGKQLKGYLKASGKHILMINLKESMPTPTQWQELSKELNTPIEKLLDLSRVEGIEKNSDFDANDYMTILKNNPKVFIGAIIINGAKTEHITSVTKVLNYFDVDSAGIDKTFNSKKPDIDKSTENNSIV